MTVPRLDSGLVLSAEQIANAPAEVRQWLRGLYGEDDRGDDAANSVDGLAVCSEREIETLLHMLDDDLLSCQVLFGLGRDDGNAAHRAHVIQLTDFLHHTDAQNIFEALRSLDSVNAALQRLRSDPYATIYRPDGMGGFRVDSRTQRAIHHTWQHLLRLTSSRRRDAFSVRPGSRTGPVEAA